jgi:hypothetical protein
LTLGLKLPPENIHALGYRAEVADQSNGQMNHEYQAVHLASCPLPLTSYRPNSDEVYGLLAIRVPDCFLLFTGKMRAVEATGIVFNSASKMWEPLSRSVMITDFIPRIQPYYLTAAIMAERLYENRFPLGIS